MTLRRRSRRRRLPLLVALVLVAGIVTGGGILVRSRSQGAGAQRPVSARPPVRVTTSRHVVRTRTFAEHHTGVLAEPVQDAAAVSLDRRRLLLLGGLTAADRSRPDILVVTSRRGRPAAHGLPVAVHDTAGVLIGQAVYLFGGGTNAGTQSDAIVRVPLGGQTPQTVGHLPAPSSDQAAAVVRGVAYVVGGFTGTRWLDTIVAWLPGARARIVARLPFPLRYAAVSATAGRLVIAGGSLESGQASTAVLEYTPAAGSVKQIGRLPAPTTHAAAAALGGDVYVIGGRGASLGSATARIVAVDARTHRIRPGGSLSNARSDLAAATVGDRILLAGGRGAGGTVADLSELVPVTRRARRVVARVTSARSVYAFDGVGMLTGAARRARPLVYVPNSQSDNVDVIDPRTFRVVERFAAGVLPQHIVPAWNLRTLYVTNDVSNTLTPINPVSGRPSGSLIHVDDPYNMYFTPGGRYAIVVAERLNRLDFRGAQSFRLHRSLNMPCRGVDHMDFTADGRFLLASCEFSGQLVVVDVHAERVVRVVDLPDGRGGMPQDVKLSAGGRLFYVADMRAAGVWEVDSRTFRVERFLHTGAGAHGLYPSRDGTRLFVTNRLEGSISVIEFSARRQIAKWQLPGHASPDMGGVSADGKVLWLSGRYNAEVYAISTRNGRLLARIHVGNGPHGLCVWPQPGRYSLGHTGNLR